MIHKLKILPEYFNLVEKNKKRFELRRNDRKYQEDDILLLSEYVDGAYTGRQVVVKVTNIFGGNNEMSLWAELEGEVIINSEYVILSIQKINVPVEILMELEHPEQSLYKKYGITNVTVTAEAVNDGPKRLQEGTPALNPPPNPWNSENHRGYDDGSSADDGE